MDRKSIVYTNIRVPKEVRAKLKARAVANYRSLGGEIAALLDAAEAPTPVAPPAPTPTTAPVKPSIAEYAEVLDATALGYLQDKGSIRLDLEKIFGNDAWDDEKLNGLKIQVRGNELGAVVFGKWEKLGDVLC